MRSTQEKPKVYIETSVISYYCSKYSPLIHVASKQQLTQEWWSSVLDKVSPYISDYVFKEIKRGDKTQVDLRINAVKSFQNLEEMKVIEDIATKYLVETQIPEKARMDAFHLACACYYEMDYLLTWNCKHIASGIVIKKISTINKPLNLKTPIILTPEELMEV